MTPKAIFSKYLADLASSAAHGDATEESFYPALKQMLEEFAMATGRSHVDVTALPKRTEGGNPDFRLWNGSDQIGYIEAKKPTVKQLNHVEETEQLCRYLTTFPNLILTNFLEFRLYRNGKPIVDSVCVGRPLTLNRLGAVPPLENEEDLCDLLNRFLDFALPRTFTAESLAVELAKRTRLLRDVIGDQLNRDDKRENLSGFFEAFQTYLIGSLTPEDFADLFAQTITYGLFAARTRTESGFDRKTAVYNIPHTIGILQELFGYIASVNLPAQIAWCVEDIAQVLSVADAPGILDEYYRRGKGGDPIVHFYETFLAEYNPEERDRRGVYYTPEPVVGYIVRSLHSLLKSEFTMPDGLASEGVTLLDPAAGTMTFVARAAEEAVKESEAKWGSAGNADFIRKHVLRNFYAFELMMAPYAVGHLKMGFLLEELGYRIADDERMPFYLTNTLDFEELKQTGLPWLSSLADESRLANDVKSQKPILLILGNPPYSGHSSNQGKWIRGLIDEYKQVDGKPLSEKQPKWLQDDYVKFLRFAQWKIEQAGRGVVSMITNHSYLDNPTFRGMRRSLMSTFDDIYILDLHGNSLKKETDPHGGLDQNVFDIRQGVSVAFFVKRGSNEGRDARIYHYERYGTRQNKYVWLNANDHGGTKWQSVLPVSPLYLFVPRDEVLETAYRRFISIKEVFPVNNVGIVTARDRLSIHFTADDVWRTVRCFSGMDPELAREAYELGKDSQAWDVLSAQNDLLRSGPTKEEIKPILYRPFDVRYTYYTGHSNGFMSRPGRIMSHMLPGNNLALCVGRQGQVVGDGEWNLVYCSETVGDFNLFYRGGNANFPLYLFTTPSDRRQNLSREVNEILAQKHDRTPLPEDIFHYIYAILYAPAYREKYAEFLRREFPRVPFTTDREVFTKIADLGARLTKLHLLTSSELDPPTCRFEGKGETTVAKTKADGFYYDPDSERKYVNKTHYFGPIPQNVYHYRIGGYQVCYKWLKDRKGRRLDDYQTYCRIVTAIGKTIEIQKELDTLYPDVEKDLVTISAEQNAKNRGKFS
ncbi:MAG: N-6 DNA methylase [Gemmatimonadota bacterium]|nr:N-6 DNA methylase [Gemmatimonadota bacterium]